MMGYGMAKAAVHQLTKSLANPKAAGLPEGCVTVAILPVTLDTPMNRKFMPGMICPIRASRGFFLHAISNRINLSLSLSLSLLSDADTTTWTSMDYLAELFMEWVKGSDRPASGSLVQIVTAAGKTTLTPL